MNKKEFENLKIGDIVEITSHGKNRGKKGLVSDIKRNITYGGGKVFLAPIDCEFEFYKTRRTKLNEFGLSEWKHESINYPKPQTNKHFYVGTMFGEKGISWPAKNFTSKELDVIDRFLKEFNERASGCCVDCIVILDDDEDEE
jgi:hypothetical protein